MVTTSLLEDITQKAATLPVQLQREALDFIEFLAHKMHNGATVQNSASSEQPVASDDPAPVKSIFGLWADRGINITDEDIAEARREMWGNFPREFPQ